jgi:hypothetical protein
VGKYIAHRPRKLKSTGRAATPVDRDALAAREREILAQREAECAALERARAEKKERARTRAASKRETVVDLDRSGRRRTAARAAGLAVISATAGLHTHAISISRRAGSSVYDLWSVEMDFDVERGFTYYFNDPTTPVGVDAVHAMRALAPGVAEQLLMGCSFSDGVDENNIHTVWRLVESYIGKSYGAGSLADAELRRLSHAIFNEFRANAQMRLLHFRRELEGLAAALMDKTKLSRSECRAALARVYDGFEEFYRNKTAPELFRAPSSGKGVSSDLRRCA